MSSTETVYKYMPQNEGDHLADSQQVPGAKSGAQLDSENRVSGAGVFEEYDANSFRKEGYDQRAKEDRYEIDQANWRAEEAERRAMEAEQQRDKEATAEAIGTLIGLTILAVECGVPVIKDKVVPWSDEHIMPHVKEATRTVREKLAGIFGRPKAPSALTETQSKPVQAQRAQQAQQESIEMTAEEYNALREQAIRSAMTLAATANKLSIAKVVDAPEENAPAISPSKLAENAEHVIAAHPEMLNLAWEEILFRKPEGEGNQRMLNQALRQDDTSEN